MSKEEKDNAGIAYIYASFNNTIVHITDLTGSTISRVSGGQVTKHDRLKANPTIDMFVAKKAAEVAKDAGITSLYVRIKAQTGSTAPGPGAHAAVKSLGKEVHINEINAKFKDKKQNNVADTNNHINS